MNAPFIHFRSILLLTAICVISISCKKKEEPQPNPAIRPTIDYNLLTPSTSYTQYFVDEKGQSTVDRTEGRTLLRMLTALDAYCKSAVTNQTAIDSAVLSNMFRNKSNPFSAPYADLNGLSYSIQQYTATSTTFKTSTDQDFEKMFGAIAKASLSVGTTAAVGSAGVYQDGSNKYLVDTAGLEYAAVIPSAFIGALQLDYISNVLLFTGINANNQALVAGKNYTALEHNWDVAYGLLTANDNYAFGATDATLNPGESFIGAALWKNNKNYYGGLHWAFLRGRAAIVNNDQPELRKQAVFIRTILEAAIGASAANSTLDATTNPAITTRIHSFGEGYGYIYATRFSAINGGDVQFSEGLKKEFFNSTVTRFANIPAIKFHTVTNTIRTKFKFYN